MVLDRREPPDDPDHRALLRQAETCPGLARRHAVRSSVGDVDPDRHHVPSVRPTDAHRRGARRAPTARPRSTHRCEPPARRSVAANAAFFSREKYSCSTCPWKVCTTTGTPARRATTRPRAPALARWVCTICGRHRRTTPDNAHSARASLATLSSRPIQGRCVVGRSLGGAQLAFPGPDDPHTNRVSNPRDRSSRVRKSAWRDGPPTFNRVITRSTRGSRSMPEASTLAVNL